ncbi:hypothetical protein Nepgr_033935 [Nepenthes gracilis]|uniref:Uncharacterized protein n=1 Tax=Nepenthes gracilis TaxID=150966 RepID=A0AAD3TMS1_NEPGR|nr:hypothetical protein Nepgr_033935 [Nepenthes gracilis]
MAARSHTRQGTNKNTTEQDTQQHTTIGCVGDPSVCSAIPAARIGLWRLLFLGVPRFSSPLVLWRCMLGLQDVSWLLVVELLCQLLTAAEMVQCHILAAGIVLDDLAEVGGSAIFAAPDGCYCPILEKQGQGSCWLAEVELEVVAALMKMEYAVASAFMLPFAHM